MAVFAIFGRPSVARKRNWRRFTRQASAASCSFTSSATRIRSASGWGARPSPVTRASVEACDAGTLTQVKGARASPAVSFPLPGDDSVEGVAFVASTAAGESAQESAALGGSFFTHHLEVALRGAGDADGDGRVTLAEAFRYASGQTVSGTFGTQAGPQHPTYALRMSGRGDVVLAGLRGAGAHLILPGG